MPEVSPVTDQRPPSAMLRIVNPLLRGLIASPVTAPLVGGLAVLHVHGRKTGRELRIVVGWHEAGGGSVVFTPAPWRLNFRGGTAVEVRRRGRRYRGTGELVEDPAEVAAALREVLDSGTPPRQLGLKVAPGHRVTAQDVVANRRAMIRLTVEAG